MWRTGVPMVLGGAVAMMLATLAPWPGLAVAVVAVGWWWVAQGMVRRAHALQPAPAPEDVGLPRLRVNPQDPIVWSQRAMATLKARLPVPPVDLVPVYPTLTRRHLKRLALPWLRLGPALVIPMAVVAAILWHTAPGQALAMLWAAVLVWGMEQWWVEQRGTCWTPAERVAVETWLTRRPEHKPLLAYWLARGWVDPEQALRRLAGA